MQFLILDIFEHCYCRLLTPAAWKALRLGPTALWNGGLVCLVK